MLFQNVFHLKCISTRTVIILNFVCLSIIIRNLLNFQITFTKIFNQCFVKKDIDFLTKRFSVVLVLCSNFDDKAENALLILRTVALMNVMYNIINFFT